ncbi:MAG: FAD synthetase family protein, partial [Rhodothermia bacterium]|nr:FAD synthetase family protein [Rhodothermia bacterium]
MDQRPKMVEYFGVDVQQRPDSIVTVGTFDGVHRGHSSVLSTVVERAAVSSGVATVITFDPHPREITSGDIVPLITTIPERIDLLSSLGIDRVVVVPFDNDFASIAPDEYVRTVLFKTIGLKEIVIGYDHTFGRSRSGDSDLLESLGAELGFKVSKLPAERNAETVISSSTIRSLLLRDGNVSRAAELLG